MTLQARHLEDGGSCVLELSGEADIATMGLLRQELELLVAMHRADAVLDVSRLTFCDVASAHMILTARRTIPFTVRGATASITRVFDLLEALRLRRLPRYLAVRHPPTGMATRSRSWVMTQDTSVDAGADLGRPVWASTSSVGLPLSAAAGPPLPTEPSWSAPGHDRTVHPPPLRPRPAFQPEGYDSEAGGSDDTSS